ncbi:NERD domain-containing protein [Prevotella histicola]|jgi:DNA-binding protein|uniref:NERD domain-containing protein n=1 Tax=Prevotella histicola TaxID=470565 RepID=UPI001C5FFB5D|nr:NERD domain-containing protein [Prevotella histicola]MBF1403357.1 NERD domain-containing protein [Prevotella histicola]MBW4773500.1 NERD domain-containing protein [Prevotella histicola]
MNLQIDTLLKILFLISLFAVLFLLKYLFHIVYAKIRGKYGEKRIAWLLKRLPDEYTIFNDVYITKGGGSVQIDHVVLSPYGIFVIETKNLSGWIYGGERAVEWTQNLYGRKFKILNPLNQNYSHVKALESLFGFPNQFFIPIVVFSSRASLKGHYPNHIIIYKKNLLKTIRKYHDVVLADEILEGAINKLSYSSFKTRETSSNHIRHVKNTIRIKKSRIRQGRCPDCGGSLVYRNGKYGSFYGCSNYPKCRYTLKN